MRLAVKNSKSLLGKDFEFLSFVIKTLKIVDERMKSEFTFELAQYLYTNEQLVDFDWGWQVLGYSTKGNAKRMLTNYFEQNLDYFIQPFGESLESLPYEVFNFNEGNSNVENSKGGRPSERIYLTVNCFKELGMLARSEQGRLIRKYFLQCERIAKSTVLEIPKIWEAVNQLKSENQQLHEAIANITNLYNSQQEQIQSLLPVTSSTTPPGWDAQTWNSLPSQDKRHFRFLYRRRKFRPSDQGLDATPSLPAISTETMKKQQREELKKVQGEVSEEELQRINELKQQMLDKFNNQG